MTAPTTTRPPAAHLHHLRDLSLAASRTGAGFTVPVHDAAELRAVLAATGTACPAPAYATADVLGPWVEHADPATVAVDADGLTITVHVPPSDPGTVVDRVMVLTGVVRASLATDADAVHYLSGGAWLPLPLPLHSCGRGVATAVRLYWSAT